MALQEHLLVLEEKVLGVIEVGWKIPRRPAERQAVRAVFRCVEITVLFRTGVPGAILCRQTPPVYSKHQLGHEKNLFEISLLAERSSGALFKISYGFREAGRETVHLCALDRLDSLLADETHMVSYDVSPCVVIGRQYLRVPIGSVQRRLRRQSCGATALVLPLAENMHQNLLVFGALQHFDFGLVRSHEALNEGSLPMGFPDAPLVGTVQIFLGRAVPESLSAMEPEFPPQYSRYQQIAQVELNVFAGIVRTGQQKVFVDNCGDVSASRVSRR